MRVRSIPIDLIRPGTTQARRHFDRDRLAELAASIRECGMLQPVVLRTVSGGCYELLAGERRWRAAQEAGLHELPAVVRDDLSHYEAQVLGLVENLQRESLSPIETAVGLQTLLVNGEMTHQILGKRIGKSRVYVTNYLRLLSLEPEVQTLVDSGDLSIGHAKTLAALTRELQLTLAQQTLHERLSVRSLERRVGVAIRHRPTKTTRKCMDLQQLERTLSEQLGYPVQLKAGPGGSGYLRLGFSTLDELDGLLEQLGYERG